MLSTPTRSRLFATAAVAVGLTLSACADSGADSAGSDSSDDAPQTTSDGSAGTTDEVADGGFCDAVVAFDAMSPPGGPEDPTPAELTAYAGSVVPVAAAMADDAPNAASDAVATLADIAGRVADGDVDAAASPELDAAIATVEDAARDDCDVVPLDAVATDFAFDVPPTLAAGVVSVRMVNDGAQPHVLLLVPAPDDGENDVAFLDGFMAAVTAVDAGETPTLDPEFAELAIEGNFPFAMPGQAATSTRVLEAGTYIYFCPIPVDFADPASPSHYQEGMLGRLTLEG